MRTLLVDENRCLKAELQNASNSLKLMKQELNNSPQYSRRDCLEIKGIPIQTNEVTNEVVKSVGNLIGVEVKDDDISISHRLAVKQNRQTIYIGESPVLGPVLFSLYVNDFHKSSNILDFHLFADDSNIFLTDKNFSRLELTINEQIKYIDTLLPLNIGKSNFILFYPTQKKLQTIFG